MTNVAWAAGLFEGEGSITCKYIDNRTNSIRTQLTLSSCDRDVIEMFCKAVNCGKVLGPYKPQKIGHKERFNWHVQNQRDCLYVIGQIFPFLGHRRKEKANELIDLIFTRSFWAE